MRKNLMGFKKVTGEVPSMKRKGKYDDLINVVRDTGDAYYLDFESASKAKNVATTIGYRLKKAGIHDVKPMIRGTSVYVMKEDDDD